MGFLTWIFPSRAVHKAETERRAQRDAEILKLQKLETDKLHEVQQAALAGDADATIKLKDYERALDDQSVKLLRENAHPKPNSS